MYAKGKGSQAQAPSDVHAKEKLALYVYDYLMHVGATKSAQTFLSEVLQNRWDKQVQISLTDPPGFLLSWWNVFWDLYCAAPERRDAPQNECSNEAKAFHDYGFINSQQQQQQPQQQQHQHHQQGGYNISNGMLSHSPQMPPQQDPTMQQQTHHQQQQQQQHYYSQQHGGGMPMQNNQQMQMMPNQMPYARFPGGPRMRMPQATDYNGPPLAPNQMPPQGLGGMDSPRHVLPGLSPMNRLTPPHAGNRPQLQQQQQQMSYNSQPLTPQSQQQQQQQVQMKQTLPPMQQQQQYQQQPPIGSIPPHLQQQGPNPHMNMQQQANRWPGGPGSAGPPMNYSSPSPVPYGALPPQQQQHNPGTPIMQSPQDPNQDMNSYGRVPPGMTFHDPNLSHMVSMNPADMSSGHHHLNGDMMDTLKSSPNSRLGGGGGGGGVDEHASAAQISDINSYANFGDVSSVQNESDAILKLKESMQEETKRFEKQQQNHDMIQYPDIT